MNNYKSFTSNYNAIRSDIKFVSINLYSHADELWNGVSSQWLTGVTSDARWFANNESFMSSYRDDRAVETWRFEYVNTREALRLVANYIVVPRHHANRWRRRSRLRRQS